MKNCGSLRVCIVGSGDMGKSHALGWRQVDEAELVAFCDLDTSRAKALAEEMGISPSIYAGYEEAIDQEDVNVVSVCTPTYLHKEIAIYAMSKGRHVICEKPIALTLGEAEEMIRTSDAQGCKLQIGFMQRYSRSTAKLKEVVSSNTIGRPILFQRTELREVRPKVLMHDKKGNGGPVIDMCVHIFDKWAHLFKSKPVRVYAQGFVYARNKKRVAMIEELAVDTAVITVTFESGDVGTYMISWGMPEGFSPVSKEELIGPDGLITTDINSDITVTHTENLGTDFSELETAMYVEEIKDFARTVLQDREPLVSARDGKAALRVALAALESIHSGRVIEFFE